ncbi:MAG: hypothetical protein DI622_11125 [Chryseobacterium sp.]|uniref:hypothetical protein n=1 Tax=Chryseobacterium sp. TaxID=1871047 RepID=UPI000DB5FF06|nr:hypothetical protein [Chryseobacterium sp.]MPS63435.1 hypothetical protein [Chryseobacterium sp.]PZU16961.1 MAG: hypothetical protein DI622_11125 [Chryseobacterium sp.]
MPLRFISRIIIKGKITIPENRIHFHVKDKDGNDYTDIPFHYPSIEDIRDDLSNYLSINEINIQLDYLSNSTKELLQIVRELNLQSFLIESFISYGDSYPIDDLITIIIDQQKILPESLLGPIDKNNGDLFKDVYGYEYWDILYHGYEYAQLKYQKEQEK